MSGGEAALERAVLCSFDGACSAEQRSAAHAFLEAAKAAPGAWRAAAERYGSSGRVEVRFWCLSTLVAAAEVPAALSDADRAALRPAAAAWLLERPSPPPFLRAKAAQLFAALLAADAAAWPHPLEPLLAACAAGDAAPLAAALSAVHHDAVCLDFDSSPGAVARSAAVKEALKAHAGAQRLCGTAAAALAAGAADVAGLVDALAPFLDWLDLEAAAGEAAPLAAALGAALAPQGDAAVRAAAARALARLLARKLPSAASKLAMLRRLSPPEALHALAAAQDAARAALGGVDDDDEDGEDAVEALIATAAAEYTHALRHASQEGTSATPFRAEADACADALFPLVVCRLAARRAVGELPPATAAFVDAWLSRGTAEQAQVQALVALLPTLRAVARAAPAAAAAAVSAAASAAMQPLSSADVAPADVEAVLVAVHALGEGVPAECEAAMSALACAIAAAASSMPHAAHPRVATAALELVVRYWKAFPAHALPAALTPFLDARGVMCPDAAAASRAAYLLTRFARAARPQLAPVAVDALAALLPALRHVLSCRGSDARLCAFEAAGLLLGAEEVPPADASRCAAAVLGDIATAIEAAAAAATGPCAEEATERLAVALGALTALSKGFPPSQTRSPAGRGARPTLASALAAAFAVACRSLGAPAASMPRGTALLHRCCEALGDAALPMLPAALGALLARATSASAAELLQLLAALAQRYGPRVAPLLGPALPALFQAATAAAAAAAEPGCEAEARGAAVAWHAFLLALTRHAGGARLLLDPHAAPIVSAAATDAATARDVATRRAALGVLAALVRAADGETTTPFDAPAGFDAAAFAVFAAQHIGVAACLLPLLRGDLDTQDANSAALLGEMAAVGSGTLARGACAAAWAAAARSTLLSAAVAPADAAEFEARFCTPPASPPVAADGKGLRTLAARLAAAAAPALHAAGMARVPAG